MKNINKIKMIKGLPKKEYYKKRYELNKEKILKYNKEWKQKNKDKNKEHQKDYYQINKDKIIQQQEKYRKRRFYSDINFRILRNLRSRVWMALKRNSKKANKTIKLIGCSLDFLKKYLKLQFKSGMSWNNYGLWHIDHIIPCASFDLSNPDEQRKCFHYTNLQPLWAKENLSKNKKKIK